MAALLGLAAVGLAFGRVWAYWVVSGVGVVGFVGGVYLISRYNGRTGVETLVLFGIVFIATALPSSRQWESARRGRKTARSS